MTDATVVAAAVTAAKAMLRLEGTAEDAVLTRLVKTAFEAGEAFCGQAFATRRVTETVRGTGAWQSLAARPVTAIVAVEATGGGALAVDAWTIDIVEGTGRVRLPPGVVALVTAEAGMAARWNALPAPIAHGVVLLAVHLFENRMQDAAPPAAIAALWRPYRRIGIGR
jgi:uncharacterized phiE125 gp8 family phage protein